MSFRTKPKRDGNTGRTLLVLIGSYLLLVFVLPVALSLVVSYRSLHVGRDCAQCRHETLRLRAAHLQFADALNPLSSIQRRWCIECGWQGLARIPRREARAPRPQPAQDERPQPTQTLTVCSLNVDGAPWRVMLQCWSTTGLFYGRFLFVAPTGRLWLDAVEAFHGANEREVLGQALSLPEQQLEHRLRRLTSKR